MKCKVLNNFVDKETEKLNRRGDVIDVTESRLKEIQSAGNYVEVIKQTTKAKKTE